MKEVDVGDLSPAVFTRLERDDEGRPVAAFVSRHGDVFCLERGEVELRIRYLLSNAMDASEERRALRALRAAGG